MDVDNINYTIKNASTFQVNDRFALSTIVIDVTQKCIEQLNKEEEQWLKLKEALSRNDFLKDIPTWSRAFFKIMIELYKTLIEHFKKGKQKEKLDQLKDDFKKVIHSGTERLVFPENPNVILLMPCKDGIVKNEETVR